MIAKGNLIVVEDPGWRKFRGLVPKLKRAAAAAARAAGFRGPHPLTVLLTNDRRLKELNRTFRGKDKPTNVLSFPATPNPGNYRGDVALALGVARREAEAADKRLADHASHLVVHGILHLAGYDHVRARDAKAMEALETSILNRLQIANPDEAMR